MDKKDIKIVFEELNTDIKIRLQLLTVLNLQYQEYKACGKTFDISEDAINKTILEVIVFAKINILFDNNIINEVEFYKLSDSYTQYLCVKKEYGRMLNMDEEDRTSTEKERLISLREEASELEEVFVKYDLLDFNIDIYKILEKDYLLKIGNR